MYILGINAYHGDAAAALVCDGQLIAAVEEERFNRCKHSAGFPTESIRYCLAVAGIQIDEVEHIGISRDPSAHLHRKILYAATRLASGRVARDREVRRDPAPTIVGTEPDESAILGSVDHPPVLQSNGDSYRRRILRQVRNRLGNAARVRDLKDDIRRALGVPKNRLLARVHHVEHHRAHLASSFYVSPFERAALLSIDGFGDFVSTMWGRGCGHKIEIDSWVEFPPSLGLLYTAITQYLGFTRYGDQFNVIGLSPY